MPQSRLLTVIITTPRKIRGPWLREISDIPVAKRLRLDAPHQVVVQNAQSSVDLPEPPTTINFQYSHGYADGADYNEGPGEIEGEITKAVKKAFELEKVYITTTKLDYKQS